MTKFSKTSSSENIWKLGLTSIIDLHICLVCSTSLFWLSLKEIYTSFATIAKVFLKYTHTNLAPPDMLPDHLCAPCPFLPARHTLQHAFKVHIKSNQSSHLYHTTWSFFFGRDAMQHGPCHWPFISDKNSIFAPKDKVGHPNSAWFVLRYSSTTFAASSPGVGPE